MFSTSSSTSATPYLGPPRMAFAPYMPSYDVNGRQHRFYESPEQRAVRLAFMNAGRVASWVDTHKTNVSISPHYPSLEMSQEELTRALFNPRPQAKTVAPNVPSAYLQPMTESEEIEEPYILYSSSDSLSSSSSSSPQSSPVPLEEMPRLSSKHRRHSSSSSASISRRPSLDSIIEVSEE
jgi:hypothetical protein